MSVDPVSINYHKHLLLIFNRGPCGANITLPVIQQHFLNQQGLGVPFNIASYALLTYMIAHVCELKVGECGVCDH